MCIYKLKFVLYNIFYYLCAENEEITFLVK